ncbi:cytochrome P450 [Streptomyces sp. UG1]|uniref:cytochrome P450 n=1 Tax=Streptomyces sp. UG1 TaxID=3417652 RepID=UPI003CF01B6F
MQLQGQFENPLAGLDVFAEFDRDAGGNLGNPHSVYDEIRARGPVYRGDLLTDTLGLPSSNSSFWEGQPYTVLGHAEAVHCLRDSEHFSNSAYTRTVGKTHGTTILVLDAPEHTRQRRAIQKAFTRKAIEHWRQDFVTPEAHRRLDAIAAGGRTEFVRDFALVYPAAVLHHIIGLPDELFEPFNQLAIGLLLYRSNPELAVRCSASLGELISAAITEARANPSDNFLSWLCQARTEDGDLLDDLTLVSFVRILLPAGAETTSRALGTLFYYLTADPSRYEAVRDDRELVANAIDEALRIEPPTQYSYRLCVKDTVLGGEHIPAGSPIAVSLSAANRDPEVFESPHEFRLDRKRGQVAFGNGVHVCIGQHLALMETTVALNHALDVMPKLRRDKDAVEPELAGIAFRSPAHLNLRCD